MCPGEDLFFQYLCPLAFVYTCDFEDLGGIQVAVGSSSHDGYAAAHDLIYGHTRVDCRVNVSRSDSVGMGFRFWSTVFVHWDSWLPGRRWLHGVMCVVGARVCMR